MMSSLFTRGIFIHKNIRCISMSAQTQALADNVLNHDRVSLARAITLGNDQLLLVKV